MIFWSESVVICSFPKFLEKITLLPPYASSFEVMPFSILLIYMNEYYMNNIYEWTAIHSLHFFTRNSVFNKQLPSNSIKINFPFAPLYSISFFSSALCLSMSSFSININVVNKYLGWIACFMLKISASVSNFQRRFCILCEKEVLCCTTNLDNVECWIRLREPKGY